MATMDLAMMWEGDGLLRNKARQNGALTSWPSKSSIGIASVKSCALNVRALELTADWWCDLNPSNACVILPIDHLRPQATMLYPKSFQKNQIFHVDPKMF